MNLYKNPISIIILSCLFTGCSTMKTEQPIIVKDNNYYNIPEIPTEDWINRNLIIFEQKATKKNATEFDIEAFDHLKNIVTKYSIDQSMAEDKSRLQKNNMQTMVWGNIGLGGASVRQPSYIHVLANKNNTDSTEIDELLSNKSKSVNDIISDTLKTNSNSNSSVNSNAKQSKNNYGSGYSYYELQRWERYCTKNSRMEELDWLFITKELKSNPNLHTELIPSCTPPTYSFDEYKNAWFNFCSEKHLNDKEKKIVHSSNKPKALNCPRIKK